MYSPSPQPLERLLLIAIEPIENILDKARLRAHLTQSSDQVAIILYGTVCRALPLLLVQCQRYA